MTHLRLRTKIFLSLALLLLAVLPLMFTTASAIIQRPIIAIIDVEIERVYLNLERLQREIINTQLLQGSLLTTRQDFGAAIDSLNFDPAEFTPETPGDSNQSAQSAEEIRNEYRQYAINTIEEQINVVQSQYQSFMKPDFLLATDAAAEVVFATPSSSLNEELLNTIALPQLAQLNGDVHTSLVYEDQLFQLVLSPFFLDNTLKGYMALGFAFDSELINDILPEPNEAESNIGLGHIFVAYVSENGQLLADNIPDAYPAAFTDNLIAEIRTQPALGQAGNAGALHYENDGELMTGRYRPISNVAGETIAYEVVVTSKTQALSFLPKLQFSFFIIAAVGLLVSGVLGYFISRSITKPVDLLAHAAEQLRQGNMDYKITYSSQDELGVLADAMERMRESILNRIDQIKALQNELIQKEKLASIGSVASAINHEIRNQLSFGMAAELIQQQYPNDPTVQQYTQMILEARDYILRMLDDIRNFTREGGSSIDYEMKSVDLADLIEHTVQFAKFDKEMKHINIMTDLQAVAPVRCDSQRIGQVIINMIRNAGHAMDKSGDVIIRLLNQDGGAGIQIEDSGVGIPAENLEQIWQPFFSTKGDKGLGLGLDICRKIITDHKGRIECESTVGVGATFTINLPFESDLIQS